MPRITRLFLTPNNVKRQLALNNRSVRTPINTFVHLTLPSGQPAYPLNYISAFLSRTRGPISTESLLEFNRQHGQSLVDITHREMLWRIRNWETEGLLTPNDISRLLNVSTVGDWYRRDLLPCQRVDDRVFIRTDDLLARCNWVIPT